MKKTLMLLLGSTLAAGALHAQTVTVLIDFGDDISFRGVSVPNPDPNGNYWNSVRPGFFFADLVDSNNNVTEIDYGPGAHPTDSYNGPAGDVTINGPADSDYDAAALGMLGVDEAVFDYHVGKLADPSGYYEIQNLDPNVSYTLSFYGAHKYIQEFTGTTTFNVYDDAERTNLIGTVDLAVGSIGDVHNRDMLGVISGISPAVDVGIFFIEFGGKDGVNDGYVNCMSVTYEPAELTWAGWPVDELGNVDTTPFMGWLNVGFGDYVWSYSLNNYIYMPEDFVSSGGAWTYIPNF